MTDTVPDLAPAGLGERLARRPAGQQLHACGRRPGGRSPPRAPASLRSQSSASPPKWCRWVSTASTSWSADSTTRYPAASKPRLRPPPPLKRSAARCAPSATQPRRIGEELILVRARLGMGGQADERAPDELDAVVPAPGGHCPVPQCDLPVSAHRQRNARHRRNVLPARLSWQPCRGPPQSPQHARKSRSNRRAVPDDITLSPRSNGATSLGPQAAATKAAAPGWVDSYLLGVNPAGCGPLRARER